MYLTLCCALVASAVGSYLHMLWNIGGLLTAIAGIGCIAWLLSTPPYEEVIYALNCLNGLYLLIFVDFFGVW